MRISTNLPALCSLHLTPHARHGPPRKPEQPEYRARILRSNAWTTMNVLRSAAKRNLAARASSSVESISAILAGLEERSRGAEAAFTRIDRMYGDLERRVVTGDHLVAENRSGQRHADSLTEPGARAADTGPPDIRSSRPP